jgi:Protein of unknown function (DUF4229)
VGQVRVLLVYTAGRLLVFLGAAAILFVVGLRGFVLVLVALVLSLPLSFLLLARPRAALGAEVERRVAQRRARREDLRARLRGDDEPA